MRKLVTNSIFGWMRKHLLADDDGSVKPRNLEWKVEEISHTVLKQSMMVNDQIRAYHWGKLILVTGTFQLNGDIKYLDQIVKLNTSSRLVHKLIHDSNWSVENSDNGLVVNYVGTNRTLTNAWQQVCVFGFLE